MATYTLNKAAVAKAKQLIDAHQYVLDSKWGEAQPSTSDETADVDRHDWDQYAEWHLGLKDGENDDTKGRYGFVYGDFRRVHRSGLIAAEQRAAEWDHTDIEHAARDLLQHLDEVAGRDE